LGRVYNFSPGPAALPKEVLEKAAAELVEYPGAGMSVMEMSHRSKMFLEIFNEAGALLRELLNIPNNYKILYMQGGASLQFSAVPLNLGRTGKADYVITGEFAKKAAAEAKRYVDVHAAGTSEDKTFSYIPRLTRENFRKDADYVHITSNNTIFGTRFAELPDTGGVPVVSDMSSCILSEPVDVSKFGLIYAGAQKNIGPAGVTIVIVREDLIGFARDITPALVNYKTFADNDSLYNTPPTYAIYMAKLTFEWIRKNGGVAAQKERSEKKAAILYDYIDASSLFKSPVAKEDRSLMNVPFVTGSADLDKKFISEAQAAGLCNLAGHRSVGGMRASIYNPMPEDGVKALVGFMKDFEAKNA
jgi:phosphoserine aminotransferase